MDAPLGSVTVPRTEPVIVCATAAAPLRKKARTAKLSHATLIKFFLMKNPSFTRVG
jgi:hypothetical protein